MSPEFWITTFIVVVSPGTGAVYTIATGLGRGRRASILAAFACTLGIIPHLAGAMMGLAALLHASALLFGLVKYAGVAYLYGWLGKFCARKAPCGSTSMARRDRAGG